MEVTISDTIDKRKRECFTNASDLMFSFTISFLAHYQNLIFEVKIRDKMLYFSDMLMLM